MRPSNILSTALLALTASASWLGSNEQVSISDTDLTVPGNNPLTYCANGKEPKDHILTIEKVDLDPNPPVAGKNLTISATGSLSQKIEQGAKATISVRYGLIKILTQEVDLCEQASGVDLECPIEEGKLDLGKMVALPREIPPGKYTVLANVLTKDQETITCLEATVVFSRGLFTGGDDL